MFGGVQAVTWADVKQMVVITAGMFAVIVALVLGLPDGVGLEPALHVAGVTGRLQTIDFTLDLNETYTFWSGLIGGLFLMLGYFGCDQSQVQRYLTAKSVDAGALFAPDERVHENPAPDAHSADRRSRFHLLPLQ